MTCLWGSGEIKERFVKMMCKISDLVKFVVLFDSVASFFKIISTNLIHLLNNYFSSKRNKTMSHCPLFFLCKSWFPKYSVTLTKFQMLPSDMNNFEQMFVLGFDSFTDLVIFRFWIYFLINNFIILIVLWVASFK